MCGGGEGEGGLPRYLLRRGDTEDMGQGIEIQGLAYRGRGYCRRRIERGDDDGGKRRCGLAKEP